VIIVMQKQGERIVSRQLEPEEPIPSDAIWIDMVSPGDEEARAVEKQLGIEIPSKKEVWQNEVMNRMYQENGVAYMTAAVITKVDSPHPQTSAITFILSHDFLLTMRYITPTSFQVFSQRIQNTPKQFTTGAHVLEGLLEEIITRVAHNSEVVVLTLDQLSHSIFGAEVLGENASQQAPATGKNPSQIMKDVLKRLGAAADLNSKINESLQSLSRMLSFFRQVNTHGTELDSNIAILMTDAQALTKQTAFLSDKITFQLDATLGMINVEQNMIIKIFSVVAVFFLPPTLVSSIYGMNFRHMPELDWRVGYPFALGIMILCMLVPYQYFRKRGWL
jgi:magnesium transporter